ncbi:MAG: hypothetical protein ACRDNF_11715 [Streptosporangiaceae bacterium]
MTSTLHFRSPTGEMVEAEVRTSDAESPRGEFLTTRQVWLLDDDTELCLHGVAKGLRHSPGYDRLDNEILAGRRLYEVAESDGGGYPLEVARLYGDEATSAAPYALFLPDRGEPLSKVAANLVPDEKESCQTSLLTALCWLAAAGIAHRSLSPDTVLWDGQRVQITDFSLSTVFGVPREAIAGLRGWVPREQRPDYVRGQVSECDDIWAAGRLIFFINVGEVPANRDQLADSGLGELLGGVFGPPEERPTAEKLLGRAGQRNPVPRAVDESAWLKDERKRFWEARKRKYPGAAVPPEADEDAGRSRSTEPHGTSFPAAPSGTIPADASTQPDGPAREPARRRHFRRRG